VSALSAIGWTATFVCFAALVMVIFGDSERTHQGNALFALANWTQFVVETIRGDTFWAVLDGLLAAWFTWLWWKNRRKGRGRKALKELGDKSRRRVQVLVEQMTPSPVPTPAGSAA
jgi:hypothetical protein